MQITLTRRRTARFAVPLALVALVAAGCGRAGTTADAAKPSGDADTAAVRAAERFLAPYKGKADVWKGPTTSPPAAKGKTIVFLNRYTFSETNSYVIKTARQAAAALGWKFVALDVSKDFDAGVAQAVAMKPDGLFSQVTEGDTDVKALQRIADSKIPHVEFTVGTTDYNKNNPGITHIVDYHFYEQGQLAAAQAVVQTGGRAKLGLFHAAANSSNRQEIQGIKDYFAKYGGGSVAKENVVADGVIGTPQLGQAAVAFLQGNPQINVLWHEFDGIALGAVPALKAAGLSKVPQISHEGDAPNLDFVRDGAGQVADVAVSYGWATWAAFDDLNRIFNGLEPPADDGIPVRVLTKDNLPPRGQRFEGDLDYAARYKKLWKVG
ncbi:sugar ABC transporter substrate-binding protein [Actinomadura atramentaria]|uniref:sugar ABC transporter substrate-binding protein n=1 Tax=Actinomadura atramentaria TaxID=1990 RepID=UPI00036B354A|nr:substrate-binding domain-containing protein [Actinomadura atramentaria]